MNLSDRTFSSGSTAAAVIRTSTPSTTAIRAIVLSEGGEPAGAGAALPLPFFGGAAAAAGGGDADGAAASFFEAVRAGDLDGRPAGDGLAGDLALGSGVAFVGVLRAGAGEVDVRFGAI